MLNIIRGLPGSGKSTFAKSKKFGGMLVIENDQYWIDENGNYVFPDSIKDPEGYATKYPKCKQYTREMVEQALIRKINVVVPCVFCSIGSVKEFVELAKTYNTPFKIYRMDLYSNFGSTHDVPAKVLDDMRNHFAKYLPWDETIVKCTVENGVTIYNESLFKTKKRSE